MSPTAAEPLLVVEDLRVAFPNRDGGTTEAVRGVSFTLGRERLGIVGESGSGKIADRPRDPGPHRAGGPRHARSGSRSTASTCCAARRGSGASCAAGASRWCCRTRSSR